MPESGIQIVYGGAAVGDPTKFSSDSDIKPYWEVLDKHNVTKIDTAHLYGNSETFLCQVKAGDKYTLDTKWLGGFGPGNVTKDKMIASAKDSIKKLGVKQASCPLHRIRRQY
jgi:aflatoxin B1 aldehyde reductase